MRKKVIFFDVDGTLVDNSNDVPASAIEAIQTARSNGHYCIVCTGRASISAQDVLQHGFDGYIASAGGYIKIGDQLIFHSSLSKEDVSLAIQCFEDNHILYNIETDDATYMDKPMLEAFFIPMVNEENTLEDIIKREDRYFNFKSIQEFIDHPAEVQKFCFIAKNETQLENVKKQLGERYHIVVHHNFSFENKIAGEIIIKDTDKGVGVKKVLEYLGIDYQDSICFGDSMNDAPMIKACHTSIAMGNGDNEVKKLTTRVTESVSNNGIYNELKRMGII